MREKALLVVSVTRFQHSGKSRRLFLPPPARAGLFEPAPDPELLQRLLAVEFFLEPPKRFFDGLTFFQSNLGHIFV
jgi:hypothetical protein